VSIRRLRTLIAVQDKGSFSAAADAVFISHAAVSQQMKSLEADFQVTLFDRSHRSPKLNHTGQELVAKARILVEDYDRMVKALSGDSTLAGEVSIGALPTTMTGLVPATMTALKARYDQVHVRIVPGLSADLLTQVDRRMLDAAIISEPVYLSGHLQWRHIADEPLVVIAPIETKTDDPVRLLATMPFIRFTRQAWVGHLIDEWLLKNKIKVSESMELDTLEAISSMVFHGLGVSIVPRPSLPSPNPLPLKQLPLQPNPPTRRLGLLSRTDTPQFILIEQVLAEIRHVISAHSPKNLIK